MSRKLQCLWYTISLLSAYWRYCQCSNCSILFVSRIYNNMYVDYLWMYPHSVLMYLHVKTVTNQCPHVRGYFVKWVCACIGLCFKYANLGVVCTHVHSWQLYSAEHKTVNTDQTHAHPYVWDSAVGSGHGNPIVNELSYWQFQKATPNNTEQENKPCDVDNLTLGETVSPHWFGRVHFE